MVDHRDKESRRYGLCYIRSGWSAWESCVARLYTKARRLSMQGLSMRTPCCDRRTHSYVTACTVDKYNSDSNIHRDTITSHHVLVDKYYSDNSIPSRPVRSTGLSLVV
jgi:hypothetical protein